MFSGAITLPTFSNNQLWPLYPPSSYPATHTPVRALITSRGPELCLISLWAQGHVVTFWGRSFVKGPKHTRVSSCERQRYSMRSTADTCPEVIVSRVYAALCGTCCSKAQEQPCGRPSMPWTGGFVSLTWTAAVELYLLSVSGQTTEANRSLTHHALDTFSLKWTFVFVLQGIPKIPLCNVDMFSQDVVGERLLRTQVCFHCSITLCFVWQCICQFGWSLFWPELSSHSDTIGCVVVCFKQMQVKSLHDGWRKGKMILCRIGILKSSKKILPCCCWFLVNISAPGRSLLHECK